MNSAKSAPKDPETLRIEVIEHHWGTFLRHMLDAKTYGFIGESENGIKIYSFESWLRDTGNVRHIPEYCGHIKKGGFVASLAVKAAGPLPFKEVIKRLDRKFALLVVLTLLPGICFYLLVAAFLATYDISFWGWLPAILFALIMPLNVGLLLVNRNIRAKKQAIKDNVQFVIKNFDSDELTYIRSKRKLFVE